MRSSPRRPPKLLGSVLLGATAIGVGVAGFFIATMPRSLAEPDQGVEVLLIDADTPDPLADASRAMEAGDWSGAADSYRLAVATDPSSAVAEAGWARALTFQYHFELALVHARRAVQLAPLDAASYAVLAQTLNWSGDLPSAAQAARRAIDLAPTQADGYAFLAETFTDRYLIADAEREIERALALDPTAHEPLRVRAYWLETKGQYKEAIAAYEDAINRAPRYAHLHLSLGHVHRAIGQHDAALAAFSQATQLAPLDARPPTGTGMIFAALDDLDTAIGYFEQATRLDPTYATAFGQLGTSYYRKRDYARAQEPLERAVQLERTTSRLSAYQHVLGWTLLYNGAPELARTAFQKALSLDPQLDGARQGLQAVAAAPRPAGR